MCYNRTLRPRGRSHFHFIVLGQDGGIRGRAPQKTTVPLDGLRQQALCECVCKRSSTQGPLEMVVAAVKQLIAARTCMAARYQRFIPQDMLCISQVS